MKLSTLQTVDPDRVVDQTYCSDISRVSGLNQLNIPVTVCAYLLSHKQQTESIPGDFVPIDPVQTFRGSLLVIVAEYSKGLADNLELVAYVVKVSDYPGKYIKLCFILWDMI